MNFKKKGHFEYEISFPGHLTTELKRGFEKYLVAVTLVSSHFRKISPLRKNITVAMILLAIEIH